MLLLRYFKKLNQGSLISPLKIFKGWPYAGSKEGLELNEIVLLAPSSNKLWGSEKVIKI